MVKWNTYHEILPIQIWKGRIGMMLEATRVVNIWGLGNAT